MASARRPLPAEVLSRHADGSEFAPRRVVAARAGRHRSRIDFLFVLGDAHALRRFVDLDQKVRASGERRADGKHGHHEPKKVHTHLQEVENAISLRLDMNVSL